MHSHPRFCSGSSAGQPELAGLCLDNGTCNTECKFPPYGFYLLLSGLEIDVHSNLPADNQSPISRHDLTEVHRDTLKCKVYDF